MEKKHRLWWKIPTTILIVVLELVLLLLIAVGCVLYVPTLRTTVLHKGVLLANETTDYDIDLGSIYLSPFHHSPTLFYRAYKGKTDLHVAVEIDSLFVGHRGQDTLIYVHSLRLHATARTKSEIKNPTFDILNTPILVEHLLLDQAAFHSGELIPTVGVDADVRLLDVTSPEIIIAEGRYPLHGLRLEGVECRIDLRSEPDTTAKDSTPLLLCFDLPDAELRNIHYAMTPLGLDIQVGSLSTQALINVGDNRYDAERLNIGRFAFGLNQIRIPADTIYGNGFVNLATNDITSTGLHVRSEELGARADVYATKMNLATMRIDATVDAEYKGSQAHVKASYDIDDEAYDAHVEVERVNLAPFLKDSTHIVLAGTIDAKGQGIDPNKRTMQSKVNLHLTDAVYENINVSGIALHAELKNQAVVGTLHLPFSMQDKDLRVRAMTDHTFRVAQFMKPDNMTVDYHSDLRGVRARVGGQNLRSDSMHLDFTTDDTTALALTTRGLDITARTPMHMMAFIRELQPLLTTVSDTTVLAPLTTLTNLTVLDTLRRQIPALETDINLRKGSPIQPYLDSIVVDIRKVSLALNSDSLRTHLALDAATNRDSLLPAIDAAVAVDMTEGRTDVLLNAFTHFVTHANDSDDLSTKAKVCLVLEREGNTLQGDGQVLLDSLTYGKTDLGNHTIDLRVRPSEAYENALRAEVQLNDIPLDLVNGFVSLPEELDLNGAVRATASVDGLPNKTDISAEVVPLGISARYTPYDIGISLGENPIIMQHNHVDLNHLPVYAADSTYLTLAGGLDLDSMRLDIIIEADSFAPAKLPQGGPLPVYGELATDIRGRVHGPLDSIIADVSLTLLPVTDITYPIDKKNLAQVKPYGTVSAHVPVSNIDSLSLQGTIHVDSGFARYSPKVYPIMPFHVDSGSHVSFHGPIGQTELNVSASQKVKANVQSEGEYMRSVDFRTGVRVQGVLDSIDFKNIGFFIEAPKDEQVSEELASLDEEHKEEIAAVLLATGMYMGESNVATEHNAYALTSIINSRIDASMTNSKRGKVVDINITSSENERASGTTTDFGVSLSKSFFKDRFKITVGASLVDNPEANNAVGLFGMASAEYKLTKEGNVLLRAFTQRDYNNILEGDLQKSGLGLRIAYDWKRRELYRTDSINRTYGLTADVDVAYRSNNSIGPNLTLKSTVRNLMGHNETFSIKGYGAYYWTLRGRNPGDPVLSNTFKVGAEAALIFPYLHWAGDVKPDGSTRYRLGYGYENIAGGYGVHKIYGSLTYYIPSLRNEFISHAFTPFSLSVVQMMRSEELVKKAAQYPQLLKLLASDEFIPSVGYEFTYNDYRAKRAVNTMFDLEVKEAGNLVNSIYCLFGYKWNDKKKPLGKISFNQFVSIATELHNKFNLTDKVCFATRIYAGGCLPIGNSQESPLSQNFYTGGPNSLRASTPYAYGPGNFYSYKYNQNFFHAGDVKLEANVELRFPIVWKLFGAVFVDAGNVWNWRHTTELLSESDYQAYAQMMDLHEDLYDGILNNPYLNNQTALGTGAGLRLDIEGLVIRLDLGVGIHAPCQTYKYDKEGKPDFTKPITTYFNMPSALDALRVNFGIGYPF